MSEATSVQIGCLILALLLAFPIACHSETPDAPHPILQDEGQQAIESSSAQNLTQTNDGKIHLARWSLSAFAIRDKAGWGPSSRVDYRISNRWGIAATEVKSTVSAGFTVRLGSLK